MRSAKAIRLTTGSVMLTLTAALLLTLVRTSPAQGVDGTTLRTITAQGYSCSIGTGIAFDGSDLILSCWNSNVITAVSPEDGSFLRTYTITGATDLGAMAYDVQRHKLW